MNETSLHASDSIIIPAVIPSQHDTFFIIFRTGIQSY